MDVSTFKENIKVTVTHIQNEIQWSLLCRQGTFYHHHKTCLGEGIKAELSAWIALKFYFYKVLFFFFFAPYGSKIVTGSNLLLLLCVQWPGARWLLVRNLLCSGVEEMICSASSKKRRQQKVWIQLIIDVEEYNKHKGVRGEELCPHPAVPSWTGRTAVSREQRLGWEEAAAAFALSSSWIFKEFYK